MLQRLAIYLILASAAYAGVSGTSILNYSIENQTGATANYLNVTTGDGEDIATVVNSSPFTSATPTLGAVDFSGGSVASGSTATFTLEQVGDNFFDFPGIEGYCWVSGCDPSTSPTSTPLDFYFYPGGTTLAMDTADNTVSFSGLYVTQDGTPLYTGSTSGSVGNSATLLASDINFANGPVDFGVTDTTDGVTITGSFTTAPEPATTGLCALMLLGMVVMVRRRQLRKQ